MSPDLEHLGQLIKRAQYRHHRALDTEFARIGTTLTQWDALRAVANTPGASAHDLAVATFQSDQSFGTLAARLIARGLLERRPGRGRRISHHLTPAGEQMLAAGRPLAATMLARSFSALTESERSALGELLSRVAPDA